MRTPQVTITIELLKSQGYRVQCRQTRIERIPDDSDLGYTEVVIDDSKYFNRAYPKGGSSKVSIIDTKSQRSFSGEASCNSQLDNFDKRLGFNIAFGRAYCLWQQSHMQEEFLYE